MRRNLLALILLVSFALPTFAQPAPDIQAYGLACYSDAQLARAFQWIDAHPNLHPHIKPALKQRLLIDNQQVRQTMLLTHQWTLEQAQNPRPQQASAPAPRPASPLPRVCFTCKGTGVEDYTAFANPYQPGYVASKHRYTCTSCGGKGVKK